MKTPWLLVLLHAPWYNSNYAHQGEGNRMMAAMEQLLYAAGVDLVLAGHVHAYERSVHLQYFIPIISILLGKTEPISHVLNLRNVFTMVS